MKLVSMLARGRVDDDRLISPVAVDFLHAKAMPLQPPLCLRGAQIYVQTVTFEFIHCRRRL